MVLLIKLRFFALPFYFSLVIASNPLCKPPYVSELTLIEEGDCSIKILNLSSASSELIPVFLYRGTRVFSASLVDPGFIGENWRSTDSMRSVYHCHFFLEYSPFDDDRTYSGRYLSSKSSIG